MALSLREAESVLPEIGVVPRLLNYAHPEGPPVLKILRRVNSGLGD